MRVTFFPLSAIGYVGYPEAILTRGLAGGLAERGHDVRIVEQRRNPALTRTLASVGADASRHTFEQFPNLLIHSYQPRTGAALMEWISRELSLVDVAVVVHGVQEEVARWIANLSHPKLIRLYMTFDSASIDEELSERLELGRYDAVVTPGSSPEPSLVWTQVLPAVHEVDASRELLDEIPANLREQLASPEQAALALEKAVAQIVVRRQPPGGSSASHSSNSV